MSIMAMDAFTASESFDAADGSSAKDATMDATGEEGRQLLWHMHEPRPGPPMWRLGHVHHQISHACHCVPLVQRMRGQYVQEVEARNGHAPCRSLSMRGRQRIWKPSWECNVMSDGHEVRDMNGSRECVAHRRPIVVVCAPTSWSPRTREMDAIARRRAESG